MKTVGSRLCLLIANVIFVAGSAFAQAPSSRPSAEAAPGEGAGKPQGTARRAPRSRAPFPFARTPAPAGPQWAVATSAPMPVCERTYCASNAACSVVAAFELSVTENSQQHRNDSGMVKRAGDT